MPDIDKIAISFAATFPVPDYYLNDDGTVPYAAIGKHLAGQYDMWEDCVRAMIKEFQLSGEAEKKFRTNCKQTANSRAKVK